MSARVCVCGSGDFSSTSGVVRARIRAGGVRAPGAGIGAAVPGGGRGSGAGRGRSSGVGLLRRGGLGREGEREAGGGLVLLDLDHDELEAADEAAEQVEHEDAEELKHRLVGQDFRAQVSQGAFVATLGRAGDFTGPVFHGDYILRSLAGCKGIFLSLGDFSF